MGKGDIKTRRGKLFAGSYGKKRPGKKVKTSKPPSSSGIAEAVSQSKKGIETEKKAEEKTQPKESAQKSTPKPTPQSQKKESVKKEKGTEKDTTAKEKKEEKK